MEGKFFAGAIVILGLWASLASIAPGYFQVQSTNKIWQILVLWGPKMRGLVFILCGVLVGAYIWNLDDRLQGIDASIGTIEARLKQTSALQAEDPTGLTFALYQVAGNSCVVIIDGSKLAVQFRAKYEVALVCALYDPSKDQFKDDRITISSLFTPQSSIPISVPYSGKMEEAIQQAIRQATAPIHATKEGQVVATYHIWFKAVLLPKGIDLADIHSLSDVLSHGGVISPNGNATSQSRPKPAK